MENNLSRQIRILQIYSICLTVIVATLAFLYLKSALQKASFREIDAQRINIVDSNGALRMVISNPRQQHPGAMEGKTMSKRDRPAGLIFFNDEGDECGGLVFDGNKNEAGMAYSIDQYKNDQVMQLQYNEDNAANHRARSYGLKIWDRNDKFGLSDLIRLDDSLQKLHDTALYHDVFRRITAAGLMGAERLFLGRTPAKQVGLFIRDDKGRPRIEIALDSQNNVLFRALDTNAHPVPLISSFK
jgi:hypothetical protein